jgi:quercetin dioxygenase-like cupin family protein
MSPELFALGAEEGPAVWFLNTLSIVKATKGQTGGAFGLVEQLAPVGAGAPYHVHRAEEESFHVLDGQLEFISEGRRLVKGPGGFVFLPRDIPHGFRVVGDSAARYLILTTPGGFEGFIIEAGEPAAALQLPEPSAPDIEKLTTIAARYRIEILGPLPA